MCWEGLDRDAVRVKHEGFFIDYRRIDINASPESIYQVITSLGGERGWLYANWLWQFRGWMDQRLGGLGLRGRSNSLLKENSLVDYYRVEAIDPNRFLRLYSELRAPGDGWMEWRIETIESKCLLTQTAFFAPRGLPGFLYWHLLNPLHRLVFRGLIQCHQTSKRDNMKHALKVILFSLVIILLLGLMIIIALYVPNSLHTNSDFLAIYDADLRLLQHIKPYDYQSQIHLMAQKTGMLPENVYVPQFPYPPWFALSTFYLGLLPIQSAATLWFEINLVMLFLTVWFLSADWHPRLRLFSFLAPFFFIPVIGTLGVGQYDFPVLLGSAILIYAIRHQRLALILIGAALLTFKPHVGIPIFLAVLIYFFLLRGSFGRRALVWIFSGVALLCVIGLIADPLWMIDYPLSFLAYQAGADIASCAPRATAYLRGWQLTSFPIQPSRR